MAGILAVALFALEIFRTGSVVASLIVALTFGMAAVPEEFPLVFTLYLSLGAWRLAKRRVLVKSLPSVEALGSRTHGLRTHPRRLYGTSDLRTGPGSNKSAESVDT